ncbi:hypothetical protein GA0115233_100785 [Streptomyces sp. DI166]|uniref:hypothetical protein n=1 Tax=unclassified Streptomyces TaxID=2593676 RepID=UPI0007F3F4E7|nr:MULTISPECIES: hypothetical protein [unclassified Streptomyces]SBT89171.1 hypothetical protein GA0115233_100785 [Streptomyces sp. DI166]
MTTGQPLASAKTQIFESLLGFLPDWAQHTALVLIILAVLATWGLKLRNKIVQRRALRSAGTQPAPTPVPYDQGSGADYLGAYAPQRRPEDPAV